MKKLFYIFILFSFFVSFVFAEILTSAQNWTQGPLEIFIEGAGNESIGIISPDGEMAEAELVDGYAIVEMNEPGKWIIEYKDERRTVLVLEKYADELIGVRENANSFLATALVGIIILAVILIAVAGAIYIYLDPAPKRQARLCSRKEGEDLRIVFLAGSKPLENVRVYAGEELLLEAKRLDAFERLEIKRGEGDFAGSIYAKFIEDKKEFRVEVGEESFGVVVSDEETTRKRKLTRV